MPRPRGRSAQHRPPRRPGLYLLQTGAILAADRWRGRSAESRAMDRFASERRLPGLLARFSHWLGFSDPDLPPSSSRLLRDRAVMASFLRSELVLCWTLAQRPRP